MLGGIGMKKRQKKLEPKYIDKLKEYFKEKEDAVPIRQRR